MPLPGHTRANAMGGHGWFAAGWRPSRCCLSNHCRQPKAALLVAPPAQEDLRTMFGMFDITKRGLMTEDQVNNAQRSILGPSADLEALGLLATAPMVEAQFVAHMMRACKAGCTGA